MCSSDCFLALSSPLKAAICASNAKEPPEDLQKMTCDMYLNLWLSLGVTWKRVIFGVWCAADEKEMCYTNSYNMSVAIISILSNNTACLYRYNLNDLLANQHYSILFPPERNLTAKTDDALSTSHSMWWNISRAHSIPIKHTVKNCIHIFRYSFALLLQCYIF